MPLMPLSSIAAAITAVAGLAGLAGDAPRAMAPQSVLYCTGCLCDEERPDMPVPGEWRPSGRMGDRITLRFEPREPGRTASSCRRPNTAG
ncbi:hypothetical protein [Phreatobacter sp.]|uniref:hypothetical protein n=1 Tax=Phreatobacter sp. TaxID=1966341 RepID=UPI0022C64EC3|nr:hypothetical protein [Phreatobacter sp.]MCZ8316477.1 hypothetical protein [Phreatobacter sp.]